MSVVYKLGEVCKWSQGRDGVLRYGTEFRYVDIDIRSPNGIRMQRLTLELPSADAERLVLTMQALESEPRGSATNTASSDTSPSGRGEGHGT